MLLKYAAGSTAGSGAFGIVTLGLWLGIEVDGNAGAFGSEVLKEGNLKVGGWIELLLEARDAEEVV